MVKEKNVKANVDIQRHKRKESFKVITPDLQKIWKSIIENYQLIEGAQLSNSFITLLTLDKAEEPLTSSDISKIISFYSSGYLFKPASTLKDSLENRLKREGYVDRIVKDNKTFYKITDKGKKLLKGWLSFLSAYK
jgi:hypothetical protein